MYNHILVATDGTELSTRAIETAANLAKRLGARVTGLFAKEPHEHHSASMQGAAFVPDIPAAQHHQAQEARAKAALAVVGRIAKAAGVPCEEVAVTESHPWEAIVNCAKDRDCDLIVMASHGRKGLEGILVGSETTKVLTHAKTPVLVCR